MVMQCAKRGKARPHVLGIRAKCVGQTLNLEEDAKKLCLNMGEHCSEIGIKSWNTYGDSLYQGSAAALRVEVEERWVSCRT